MATYCSHCGSPNKSSSKFCSNCGARLTAPHEARCAICGTANTIENVFCNTCGARLDPQRIILSEKPETLAPLSITPDASVRAPTAGDAATSADAASTPPQRAQWITRLRAPAPKHSAPIAEDTDADARMGDSFKPESDWLANLRAAAAVAAETEPQAAPETMTTEPPPIPQWFADIRPPTRAAPRPAVSEAPTASAPQEELPEWLVELESYPAETVAESQPTPPTSTEQLPTGTVPDWLAEMERTSIITASRAEEPAPVPPLARLELDVSDDELPDWLTAREPPLPQSQLQSNTPAAPAEAHAETSSQKIEPNSSTPRVTRWAQFLRDGSAPRRNGETINMPDEKADE